MTSSPCCVGDLTAGTKRGEGSFQKDAKKRRGDDPSELASAALKRERQSWKIFALELLQRKVGIGRKRRFRLENDKLDPWETHTSPTPTNGAKEASCVSVWVCVSLTLRPKSRSCAPGPSPTGPNCSRTAEGSTPVIYLHDCVDDHEDHASMDIDWT